LKAVLECITKVSKSVDGSKLDSVGKDKEKLIRMRAEAQTKILEREVKKLREDFPNQDQ